MTRRGLYFTQGGFWFRNNPYFNKGIKRRVGVKYTIGFGFLYQLLSFQLMGSVLPMTLKKLKKPRFKIGGNLGSFGITHDSKEAK